jgi:hypothetical protein
MKIIQQYHGHQEEDGRLRGISCVLNQSWPMQLTEPAPFTQQVSHDDREAEKSV